MGAKKFAARRGRTLRGKQFSLPRPPHRRDRENALFPIVNGLFSHSFALGHLKLLFILFIKRYLRMNRTDFRVSILRRGGKNCNTQKSTQTLVRLDIKA